MLTKDPNHRVDWSEIFSYEIKNGEIVSHNVNMTGSYDRKAKLTDSGSKNSVSTTFESNVSSNRTENTYSHQQYPISTREFQKNRG